MGAMILAEVGDFSNFASADQMCIRDRCLSRKAGIVRCCLIYYKLLLCQLHHQFGFGGGDGKLEFILQVRLLQHIDDVVLHGGWLDAEFFCNLVIGCLLYTSRCV